MRLLLALAAMAPVAEPDTVKVADSSYGRVLFDGNGYALYRFTKDRRSKPRCYGACAKAWPPYVPDGPLSAGDGADPGSLATTRRRGGRRQVTYDGQPLYYYVGDKQPGDIFCQNVVEFGGTWLLVA
jgi:predicted lipoprotein with Yx(FWY)xxD motif